jgi:endonuclease YncB( thermonuclease family)
MNTRQVYRHGVGFFAVALLVFAPVWAADELRTVIKVHSGAVVKLQAKTTKDKDVKVRYIGVDAPDRGEPFFELCRNANKALVENKKVRMQTDAVLTDASGRPLVYVYAGDVFVNAELIKNGCGLVAGPDGNVQHREFFLTLQQEAQKNRRGLWAFEDQSDEPYYVGSKREKIFHRPSCPQMKGLAFDDRLIFRSKAEVLASGYSQDWLCCPLFKKSEQASAGADNGEPKPASLLKK